MESPMLTKRSKWIGRLAHREREGREMVERYGKEGRRCIEMVPWRGYGNGVVKIERGRGIKRKMSLKCYRG